MDTNERLDRFAYIMPEPYHEANVAFVKSIMIEENKTTHLLILLNDIKQNRIIFTEDPILSILYHQDSADILNDIEQALYVVQKILFINDINVMELLTSLHPLTMGEENEQDKSAIEVVLRMIKKLKPTLLDSYENEGEKNHIILFMAKCMHNILPIRIEQDSGIFMSYNLYSHIPFLRSHDPDEESNCEKDVEFTKLGYARIIVKSTKIINEGEKLIIEL